MISKKSTPLKPTEKPHKKKSNNDLISKLVADISIAKAEGNHQAAQSMERLLKYFTSKK